MELKDLGSLTPYAFMPFERIYCSACGERWDGKPHRCDTETIAIPVFPRCGVCGKPQFFRNFKDGAVCIVCFAKVRMQ